MSVDVTAEDYYAVVPEWVLDATRTGNAVKLYAILRRYADKSSGEAHPSRRTLATRMRMARPQSIDPVVAELVDIGAVATFERWTEAGDRDSNGYRLLARPAHRVGAPAAPRVVQETAQRVVPPTAQKPQSPEPQSGEPQISAHGAAAGGGFEGLEVEASDPVGESFARAWAAWPRPESKKAAEKSYRRAARSVPLLALERASCAWAAGARAVIAASETPQRQKAATPYFVTWLNGERWTEAPPVAATEPSRQQAPMRGGQQESDDMARIGGALDEFYAHQDQPRQEIER